MRKRSRKGAPGILDVASRAQVSAATVSRCFNAPEVVRPTTRHRVERAARELGYIRDRTAGALHGRFSGSVGLVVPTINNAIFSELIEAFASRLLDHDRTLLIASHSYDLQREVGIVRSLLERRIDGIAIVGQDHDPVALEMLKIRGIPVVCLWNSQGSDTFPAVGTDNRAAAVAITEHLLSLGHRDIAMLFPDTRTNDRARDRLQGVIDTCQQAGISIPDARVLLCPYDIPQAKAIALDLLRTRPPTAIICGNDVIALGVIHAAQKAAIAVPDALSVAGIGDFSGSASVEPGLTTVRIPARRIGLLAADLLVEQTHRRQASSGTSVIIDTELIIRGSTARSCR